MPLILGELRETNETFDSDYRNDVCIRTFSSGEPPAGRDVSITRWYSSQGRIEGQMPMTVCRRVENKTTNEPEYYQSTVEYQTTWGYKHRGGGWISASAVDGNASASALSLPRKRLRSWEHSGTSHCTEEDRSLGTTRSTSENSWRSGSSDRLNVEHLLNWMS